MGEKSKAVLAHRRKQRAMQAQDESAKTYDTSNVESFLLVDPSPVYLVNPTPKHFIRKVRNLWVIK